MLTLAFMKRLAHITLLLLPALSASVCEFPSPRVAAAKANPGDVPLARKADVPDTALLAGPFHFIPIEPAPPPELLQALTLQCKQAGKAILAFTSLPAPDRAISCYIYSSTEQKGLLQRNTQQAHADFEGQAAHIVLNELYARQHSGKENALLLRRLLGPPQTQALEEGLAVYFTNYWQGQGYAHWAALLYHSGNMAPLVEILDNERFARESALVMGCLSASFTAFLIEHWGRDEFLRRYASWEAEQAEIITLEQGWHQYLAQQGAAHQTTKPRPPLPYLQGFNFAHEGYAIYNGYGSALARESLEKQAALGANAVALVPYSYLRAPRQPAFIPVVSRAGAETDEGLAQDAFTARRLGMTTVLKPQLWLGRNHWPGDVEMPHEAGWQDFFDYYYRWMRHYALLAEIHQIDLLCVGVEFTKASLQRPADWRRLIRKLRGIYSGPLTYAANWGQEFENLVFWDELDYIGLNCYYPLSKQDEPSDEELALAFGQVLQLAQGISTRYGKPLLFTEIGFTSTPTPWKEPHRDRDGSPYDGQAQARCYRIVLQSLPGQDWVKGILWWKFPSYLSHGGPGQTGFTPSRKPAEDLLPIYFGRRD